LSKEEWADLEQALERAEQMEQRIASLEKILDETNSNWRDRR
jgi:phage shock protein B